MDWKLALTNLWDLLVLWSFTLAFVLPLKKRDSRWKSRAALWAGPGSAVFLVLGLLLGPNVLWLRPPLFFALSAMLFRLCADLTGKSVLYCAVWATVLSDLVFKYDALLRHFLGGRPLLLLSVCTVLLAGLVAGVGLTIARWMPDKGTYHTGPRQLTFALVLWTISLGANLFWALWAPPSDQIASWALLILIKFYCATVLYLQHGLFQKSAIRQELAMMNTLWMQHKAQYDLSKETIALINRKCHDMKHQIRALEAACAGGAREQYLQEIEQSVRIYDVLAKTGNEVLDTVLTEKSLFCEASGIQANCVADGRLLDFMDPVDLYTIFGNALDNAIESVSAIEDRTRRIIDVQVFSEKQMLVIQIINPIGQELTFDAEDLPVSTKEPNGYHGFGLRSIRHTAEKYGGFMTVKAEDGVFYLRLLLPRSPRRAPSA